MGVVLAGTFSFIARLASRYFKRAAAHLRYLDANLALKEEALKKTTPLNGKAGRYRADDQLVQFLESL
jgi:hypothetical protein